MSQHSKVVLDRCRKRLSLVRTLGGCSWGCDAATLRATYLAYVWPCILYGFAIYGPQLDQNNFASLSRLHLQGARLITGLPMSTPTDVVLWEAHLEGLSYHLYSLCGTLWDKNTRLEDTPGSAAVSNTAFVTKGWSKLAKSVIRGCTDLQRKPRSKLPMSFAISPWFWDSLAKVSFGTHIPGVHNKSQHTKEELFERTTSHLKHLPISRWQVYTDGSVRDGKGGGGAVLYENGFEVSSDWVGVYLHAGSYQSEISGLTLGLKMLHEHLELGDTALVFTDSQALIMALLAGPQILREDNKHHLWKKLWQVATKAAAIHLQFVPSHIGIVGNEAADVMASRGCNARQDQPLDFRCSQRLIDDLLDSYRVRPENRKLYKKGTNSFLHPKLTSTTLTRLGSTTMARLRADRHPALYDFTHATRCQFCGGTPSTYHVLKRCPLLELVRYNMLPTNASAAQLLYEHEKSVIHFLLHVGILQGEVTDFLKSQEVSFDDEEDSCCSQCTSRSQDTI